MGELKYNTPCRFQSVQRPSFVERFGVIGGFVVTCLVLLGVVVAVPKIFFGGESDDALASTFNDARSFFYRHRQVPKQLNASDVNHIVVQASRDFSVPRELILAVIQAESNFRPRALSKAGAMGLMQLMPVTAAEMKVLDPYDPEENIRGGTQYLSKMRSRFRGDWKLALAAYNAGPAKVTQYGGIPPIAETRRYVRRVMEYYQDARKSNATFDGLSQIS